jgi:hypothetical protein
MREMLIAATSTAELDEELFWQAARNVLTTPNQSHPPYSTICGAIAGLLFGTGHLDQTQLDELVIGYLVGLSDSQRRIGFLHGLLKTCREAAWQNSHLIRALDEVISGWDEAEFISTLPSLRLALADLTPRETDKVAAQVAALHGEKELGDLTQSSVTEGELDFNRRVTALVLQTLANDGLSHWFKTDD